MESTNERAGNRFEWIAFRAFTSAIGALPYEAAVRAGARVGDVVPLVLRRQRRTALFNLALAFPEKSASQRDAIFAGMCRNLGRMAAEFCHLPSLTRDNIERYVSFDDRAAWESTMELAQERGAVILTGHFGNWELLAWAQGLFRHPITLVHRPMNNPLVDDAIIGMRRRVGTRSLAKNAAAREAIRALRRKEMVVIPADQNQMRRLGVFVDFFGTSASTTPGPARLAMLTGAPVIPAFLVRDGDSAHHRIVVLPPVEMVRRGDRERDVVENTQRCTNVIEEMIRKHPDHWIWFHKRWRTRPEGAPSIYPK